MNDTLPTLLVCPISRNRLHSDRIRCTLWHMNRPLSAVSQDALADYQHFHSLAMLNATKADEAIARFLRSIPSDGSGQLQKVPRCVVVWTEWLRANGPAYRADVLEATGEKFNERGTAHTVKWHPGMNTEDERISPDTILRVKGRAAVTTRGAPPTVYALWSQRYDIYPRFGVGPLPPVQSNDLGPNPEPLLGVVLPEEDLTTEPKSQYPLVDGPWEEKTLPLTDPENFDHEAWAAKLIADRDGEPAEKTTDD